MAKRYQDWEEIWCKYNLNKSLSHIRHSKQQCIWTNPLPQDMCTQCTLTGVDTQHLDMEVLKESARSNFWFHKLNIKVVEQGTSATTPQTTVMTFGRIVRLLTTGSGLNYVPTSSLMKYICINHGPSSGEERSDTVRW